MVPVFCLSDPVLTNPALTNPVLSDPVLTDPVLTDARVPHPLRSLQRVGYVRKLRSEFQRHPLIPPFAKSAKDWAPGHL